MNGTQMLLFDPQGDETSDTSAFRPQAETEEKQVSGTEEDEHQLKLPV